VIGPTTLCYGGEIKHLKILEWIFQPVSR